MKENISKDPKQSFRFTKYNGTDPGHPIEIGVLKEFHISRRARELYGIEESLFSSTGDVVFANFKAAHRLADRMNAVRKSLPAPAPPANASELNAMGLIDEIFHYVIEVYRKDVYPAVLPDALNVLEKKLGRTKLDATLKAFLTEFPATAIFRGETTVEEFLGGQSSGRPNRELVLEEMMMLWLANRNPACGNYAHLFSEQTLAVNSAYRKIFALLKPFFQAQPTFAGREEDLLSFLRAPAIASPDSLAGQLRYIRENWGFLIKLFLLRLLNSMDFIEEQTKARFGPGMGPPPTVVPVYSDVEADEPERFSPDENWMPRVVLIAKSALVWLDQLSKKYRRDIRRLDQIPDEELDWLAAAGFTSLWLIGLWERSPASRQIKRLCGNPEAEASAYALKNYEIAGDIGGWAALQNLKNRCWQRGIRMASDMVPNHTGIDSDWMIQHPDWFLQVPEPPFPSYSFNSPNLSGQPNVGIFLEEHYYDHSDAAVVFKREDFGSGETRYIYHGNDGTGMPWNDTAQLDFLNPEVREAVIQTILHVARSFPVIRFDAAMTLTKKHIQRLWYPEPGRGGDIPSRAGKGLTKRDFDKAMPEEFWREVVERIAREAPDTLLLAEAFWFMEGYFVRTLGMHRVYNSAFMNMLKNEENGKYRELIKNTIRFNPEILKRYVNFMNNPDEDTAVAQFGSGDKYFGVCTLLVTMPGLPMFGHGQVEGFSEKYGMEYRRAYQDEQPDEELVRRHQREIFPLTHRRYLFAEVGAFRLYDLRTTEGWVNEDVFAYSNRFGDERALVIYHNKFASTAGWVRESALAGAELPDAAFGQELAGGLALGSEDGLFTIFRDYRSGLQYIRENKTLRESGLFVELHAYAGHVFMDFREVKDGPEGWYSRLNRHLNGRGVPDIEAVLSELQLSTLHNLIMELLNEEHLREWRKLLRTGNKKSSEKDLLDRIQGRLVWILQEIVERAVIPFDRERAMEAVLSNLKAIFSLVSGKYSRRSRKFAAICDKLREMLLLNDAAWLFAVFRALSAGIVAGFGNDGIREALQNGYEKPRMDRPLNKLLRGVGLPDTERERMVRLLPVSISCADWLAGLTASRQDAARIFRQFLSDEQIRDFLGVHAFDETLWYGKEAFELFLNELEFSGVIHLIQNREPRQRQPGIYGKFSAVMEKWRLAHQQAGFQVEKFLALLK